MLESLLLGILIFVGLIIVFAIVCLVYLSLNETIWSWLWLEDDERGQE